MACITVPLDESIKNKVNSYQWINWSEVGRIEVRKRQLFEQYKKTRKLSKKDELFCESIDWHPVDELPLKHSFIKKMKETQGKGYIRFKNVEELRKRYE